MTSAYLRSPIWWYGGKGNMVHKLLPLIPPHHTYVEVLGGGASLLFAKDPSPVEVYNNIDSGLVNFFRVLRDPEKFARFYHLVAFTPYSREEYDFCRRTWEDAEDEVEKAYRWYIVARMSFSGCFGNSWSFNVKASYGGCVGTVAKWLATLRDLPRIHERMMSVQVEHRDFRDLIPTYDTPDTFFYLDPPYVLETRKGKEYKYEMSLQDHEDLVKILLSIKGKAMLSGYAHEVYKPLEEAGWKRIDWKTTCHAAGRTRHTRILGEGAALEKQPRVESVWLSPNCETIQRGLWDEFGKEDK